MSETPHPQDIIAAIGKAVGALVGTEGVSIIYRRFDTTKPDAYAALVRVNGMPDTQVIVEVRQTPQAEANAIETEFMKRGVL